MWFLIQFVAHSLFVIFTLGAVMGPYRRAVGPFTDTDDELTSRVLERELGHDETLLWVGRPASGIVFRRSDWIAIPFSIFWGGFAICWEASVICFRGPNALLLVGLPFVGIGLYLMLGRFVMDAHRRARTFYGLTNRRIVFVHTGFERSVVAIDLADSQQITLAERADGSGTITVDWWMTQIEARQWAPPVGAPVLEAVKNSREVFTMIQDVQHELYIQACARAKSKRARKVA